MTESQPGPQPIPQRVLETLVLPDEAASDALGIALADLVVAGFAQPQAASFDGFTIHFSGDLGAGKTTIVRALLRRLGVSGRIKSPTYTLVEPYVVEIPMAQPKGIESRQNLKLNCYHFDFYRFENPLEWLDAGFRDYFSDAVLRLVEWPERAVADDGSLLPAPDLRCVLAHDEGGRIATLSTDTERGAAWLNASAIAAAGDSSRAR
jgi:tRNA threonylcarbamoyladenosine biosynthesis protein TsaE